MDLDKIGKYIASKRKALGLTQNQLAERLGMSDKSVSKWERGVCLPDVSVYMELCEILGISLNEFIAGEDISEERIAKKSEENLIQITEDGNIKRKKLNRIIAVLIGIAAVITGILVYIVYMNSGHSNNYLQPISKDSVEMKMAEVLSGIDGAYLYNYSVDNSYDDVTFYLSVYEEGNLVRKDNLAVLSLDDDSMREGMVAVVPDFDNFKVKFVIAGSGTKYSTDFGILDKVADRKYYGRSATEISEKINIIKDKEHGVLNLIYDNDLLQAIPILTLENGDLGSENDFMYYISFCFR